MRRMLIAALLLAAPSTLVATPGFALTLIPTHTWSRGYASSSGILLHAVASDGNQNVYLAGEFSGTVDFGGGNLVSGGSNDAFLVKLDASGNHLWSQRFGGTGIQRCEAIGVDANSNLIVVGAFQNSIDFGGGNLVSAGGDDVFIAKFDASGTHLWSQRFGDTSWQSASSVSIDPSGNIYAAGAFLGTVDFGGGVLASAGYEDVFLAKFGPTGSHLWSKRFGGVSNDYGFSVLVHPYGFVYLAGEFVGTVDFGGVPLTSAGYSDAFVARFDDMGSHVWSQRLGGAYEDGARGLAVDAVGSVYLTGSFSLSMMFGQDVLTSAGFRDIFLLKFNGNGVHNWGRRFGGSGSDSGYSIATANDKVCVAGGFEGTANFGGADLASAGGLDNFLAMFDYAGTPLWSQRSGGTSDDFILGLAMDPAENVYGGGHYYGTIDLGGGPLPTSGSRGAFAVRFSPVPREPVITSVADVGNDQGRKVRIRFNASAFDRIALPTTVNRYEIYRRNDPLASLSTTTLTTQALAPGWLYAGDVPAHDVGVYEVDAATDADSSLTGGLHYSAFFIRVPTDDPYTFYDSPVDSGYSIDNLAPGIPGALAYEAGVLTWSVPDDPDVDHFAVYGSDTKCLCSAQMIDYTAAASMDVSTSPYAFYFVTAMDRSGNEGGPATFDSLPESGGRPERYVLSVSAYPNPFNPSTTVRYTLPTAGHVFVSIHDVRGAEVVVLVDEDKPGGACTVRWNGRDHRGRTVGSGVYFARIEHGADTATYKMLLLK